MTQNESLGAADRVNVKLMAGSSAGNIQLFAVVHIAEGTAWGITFVAR